MCARHRDRVGGRAGRAGRPGGWIKALANATAMIAMLALVACGQTTRTSGPRLGLVPRIAQHKSRPATRSKGGRPRPLLTLQSVPQTRDLVNANKAVTEIFDGRGLTVAVLDSGLNVKHVDFEGEGRIPARINLTSQGGPDDVTDRVGHGSNVAGIIVAHGTPRLHEEKTGRHRGIAPGANVIPIKIVGDDGQPDSEALEKGLDWVIDKHADPRYNVTVVVLSIGDDGNWAGDSGDAAKGLADQAWFPAYRKQIRALRQARVAVVVSAGNRYAFDNLVQAGDGTPARQGMAWPAILAEAISVGAVYDEAYATLDYSTLGGAKADRVQADWITPFSQRLSPAVNKSCFTDIFAPGGMMESSGMDEFGPLGCSEKEGTSQAAPVVAGAILLLQQRFKHANNKLPCVRHLEDWMREGGKEIDDVGHTTVEGHPCDNVKHTGAKFRRLDILGAIGRMGLDPCND